MGMDIYAFNDNYFRASIWSWRALCHAMELAGFDVPTNWGTNDGHGLIDQTECNELADTLSQFLSRWDGNQLTLETNAAAVDEMGRFVDPGTPDSRSPYWVEREHIQEFIDFLKECGGGFEIH